MLALLAPLCAAAPARADEVFSIRPALELRTEYDADGVVLDDGEESSAIFRIEPSVDVVRESDWGSFALGGGLRSRSRLDDADLNAMDEFAAGDAELYLSRRLSATLAASIDKREARDPIEADADGPAEVQVGRPDDNRSEAALGFAYALSPTTGLDVSAASLARDYQGGEQRDFQLRDVDVQALGARYRFALSARDSLALAALHQEVEFEKTQTPRQLVGPPVLPFFLRFGLDRQEQQDTIDSITASWSRELTPAWSGVARLGLRRVETAGNEIRNLASLAFGDAGTDERDGGFVGGLELRHQGERSRSELVASRETRPNGGVGTTLDVDSIDVRHSRRLSRRWSLDLSAGLERSESVSEFLNLVPDGAGGLRVGDFPPLVPGLDPGAPAPFSSTGVFCSAIGGPQRAAVTLGPPFPGLVIPQCVTRASSEIDTRILRFRARLNWRWSPAFTMFLSFDYRDQDSDGVRGARDTTGRAALGFRYAYDIDLL